MVTKKRNVRVDDSLWDRLERQAVRHRGTTSSEVRRALEVYVLLSESNHDAIREVLDGDVH